MVSESCLQYSLQSQTGIFEMDWLSAAKLARQRSLNLLSKPAREHQGLQFGNSAAHSPLTADLRNGTSVELRSAREGPNMVRQWHRLQRP